MIKYPSKKINAPIFRCLPYSCLPLPLLVATWDCSAWKCSKWAEWTEHNPIQDLMLTPWSSWESQEARFWFVTHKNLPHYWWEVSAIWTEDWWPHRNAPSLSYRWFQQTIRTGLFSSWSRSKIKAVFHILWKFILPFSQDRPLA